MNKNNSTITCDLVVVGAGIVGLATAMTWLRQHPGQRVVVVETESGVGRHQSGHNSGVIHSGIYYRPGSEKALLCREGKVLLETFCDQNKIPWQKCGKVIVATRADELESLETIVTRAKQNGVEHRRIHTDELRRLEPAAAGIAAIAVPETGIVDYGQVCHAYAQEIERLGGVVRLSCSVRRIEWHDSSVCLQCNDSADSTGTVTLHAKSAIACAGLHSDQIFQMARDAGDANPTGDRWLDGDDEVRIIPFRGEYYELTTSRAGLCRHLIYPVPDPKFPFLGVHFTRMIGGGVECGPNAVLALSREGYRWSDINVGDLRQTIGFVGFRRLVRQHWRMGLGEINRSLRKSAFVTALQKLIPSIRASDLVPARAGVRAQAVRANGELVDDFLIRSTPRMTHVVNAPSPAATASLAIARRVVARHENDA